MNATIEQDRKDATQVTTSEGEAPKFKMTDKVAYGDLTLFIRLPNQFQHASIREKALAAKARRVRQLRDPEADAFLVLDEEMDALIRTGDESTIVEQIVSKDWWKDHLEATKDVREDEDFEHVEEDQRRFDALIDMPEDERPAEEFAELERHLTRYNEAVDAAREERQKPRRESLAERPIEDLVADIREERITTEANGAFNMTFTKWQVFTCTHEVDDKGKAKTKRYFESVEDVEAADADLLDALTAGFNALERQFTRGLTGNS